MSWLAIHIWVELLIAAAIGGLIGWALYAYRHSHASLAGNADANANLGAAVPLSASIEDPDARARMVELETQVQLDREEIHALRNQLSDVKSSKPVAAKAQPADEDENALSWRNRYLESRVRFLEGKVSDLETAAAPAVPPEDVNDDATRLRWRNRYLEGRVKYLEEELLTVTPSLGSAPVIDTVASTVTSTATTLVSRSTVTAPDGAIKPAMLESARAGVADDLKEIAGIGPKLEKTLNSLGVYHFDQIAAWTQPEIDWVNAAISFRGRIEREKWVEQAAQLAQGIVTDGKKKYEEGRHT